MDRHAEHERSRLKLQLDAESDFMTHNNKICFHQSFETVTALETFCTTPEEVVKSCRGLLDVNLNDTVAKVDREHVNITIGCNTFPLFSLVSGGNGRTLFSFRCVYTNCSSFMDIRTFARAVKVKWSSYASRTATVSTRFPPVFQETLFRLMCLKRSNGWWLTGDHVHQSN